MKKYFLLFVLGATAMAQEYPTTDLKEFLVRSKRLQEDTKPYTGMTIKELMLDKYIWQHVTSKPYVAPAYGPRSYIQIIIEAQD